MMHHVAVYSYIDPGHDLYLHNICLRMDVMLDDIEAMLSGGFTRKCIFSSAGIER